MSSETVMHLQGHRFMQTGIAVFLLAGLWGLAIPFVALPSTAVATHRGAFLLGLTTLVVGLIWPRVRLGVTASQLASCAYVYAVGATLLGYGLASIWGAGGSALPIATGGIRGSAAEEIAIDVLLGSASVSFLTVFAMIFWGLRLRADEREHARGTDFAWRLREQS